MTLRESIEILEEWIQKIPESEKLINKTINNLAKIINEYES